MAGSPKLTQRNGRRMAGGKPIPSSDFALPGQRYPIDTIGRARDALSRISQFGTQAQKARVRRAVKAKYSSVSVGGDSSRSYSNTQPGGIEMSRRMPVQELSDLIVGRGAGGGTVIRHRRGGEEIGGLRRNPDGTWQPSVGGTDLAPHRHQGAALLAMVGTWNRQAAGPERAQPLVPRRQPELAQALGLANYDPDDDGDNDASTSKGKGGDMDGDGAAGLSPKGKAIYKKLCAKGVKTSVALAMAKRAQNFGSRS